MHAAVAATTASHCATGIATATASPWWGARATRGRWKCSRRSRRRCDACAGPMHGDAIAGAKVAARLAGSPMSTYALGSVFSPTSVAVVGASPRERSLGRLVLRQLREGGFAGPVGLVNPNYREIDGMASASRLDALGFAPELVVIAAPPRDVAAVAAAAADSGARAAIVLTRGMGTGAGSHNAALEAVVRPRGLRIVGPNCLGVIAPHANL